MACIEWIKHQVKGPTLRSNLKRRIGYNEVKDICSKKPTGTEEEMDDISATGSQTV